MTIFPQRNVDRFWKNVDKEHSETFYKETRCWIWKGGLTHNGYGRFSLGHSKAYRAHRFVWEITFGEIHDDLFVLHHCDNPQCCNPSHLFLGTQQINMDDMRIKSRSTAGEAHANHKLTNEQVSEIRQRYGFHGNGGETSTALAREFGVNQTTISYIVGQKSWKHIGGKSHKSHRLTEEQITEIRRRYSFWGIDGDDSVTLASEFGVSSKTIRNIVNRKTHK